MVLKNKTQGNFTLVSSRIVRDTSLSIEERGMLLTLLSLPDEWDLTIRGLMQILPNGREKIRKVLNSLIDKGYLVRYQAHSEGGQFGENYIEAHDNPHKPQNPENTDSAPCSRKPYTVKPTSVNQPQYNIQEIKNSKIKNTTSSPRARTRTRRRDDDVSANKSSLQTPAQSAECASHETADSQIPPETVSSLKGLGLSDRDIKAIYHAAQKDTDRITRAVEALKAQPKTVNSVTGWLITAIQQDYAPPTQHKPQGTQHFAASRDYDLSAIEAKLLHKQMSGTRAG